MKIKINIGEHVKCIQFASDRIGGSQDLYRRRGEVNQLKIFEDIVIGAMAEWASHKYLTDKGIKVSEPDMKIYEGKQKSFSADLETEKLKFHVKAQTLRSGSMYGFSWLCQMTDPLLLNPSESDYMIFCKVDQTKLDVEIAGIVSAIDIVKHSLIGIPKVPRYRETKIALYLDQIVASNIELWRF